ncbi:MAG: iron chaperone [Anaerolineae bacterium]
MPAIDPGVAAYLANLPEERRQALSELCSLIRRLRPDLREVLRDRMPTYMDQRGPVLGVASRKHDMCLYLDPSLLRSYRRELAGIHLGHNCIRFRSLAELPEEALRAIVSEAGWGE